MAGSGTRTCPTDFPFTVWRPTYRLLTNPLANNRSRIMRSKILTGAAAFILATTAGLANTTPGNRGVVVVRAADAAAGVVDDALATTTLPFWATGYYGYY